MNRIYRGGQQSVCFYSFLLIFSITFFLSCATKKENKDKQIFRYNEVSNIASLDPAFAKDQAMIWVDNQLYNGLFQLDSSLNVLPCIAKGYDISEDGLTYTFHLRDDVYFHKDKCFKNGTRKVVAQDFVYSFNRIIDEKVASPGLWIFEHVKKSDNKYSFSAIDDSTLRIELESVFPPFLGLLTMPYSFVVPKEAVEYYGEDFRKHPVGTGAFKFKYWKEGVKLVLLKNENYFEKDSLGNPLPYLDAVNISFIVDKQSVFLEFIKGNIDFLSGIDPNYKDEILTHKGELQPKYKDKINLQKLPYLNTEYLGFYMEKTKDNPLNDKLVRQAINYGFDRNAMIRYMRNNIGIAGENGIVPYSLLPNKENKTNKYTYNPQKARKLLEQSGYYKQKPIIRLSTTSSYLDLCKFIQQQLGLLDMNVKIDVYPPAELREMMAQGKTMWFRGSWIADYPDAENYLSLFYSKNFTPNGPNYTHFSNKEYDRLYVLASKENDIQKREQLYSKMNDIVIEEAPIVVLFYDEVLRFTQKNICGLTPNAMNLLILKTVYKKLEIRN